MLFISYILTSNARETARIDGRRATWKNPALSFRVIGQVEPTLRAAARLAGAARCTHRTTSVTSGGHEEAELPAYSSVPAGWLCSRLSLHRHSTHLHERRLHWRSQIFSPTGTGFLVRSFLVLICVPSAFVYCPVLGLGLSCGFSSSSLFCSSSPSLSTFIACRRLLLRCCCCCCGCRCCYCCYCFLCCCCWLPPPFRVSLLRWVPLRWFLLLVPFVVRALAGPALDFVLEAGLPAPLVASILSLAVVLAAVHFPFLVGRSFSSLPSLGVLSLQTGGSGGVCPLLRTPTFLPASADRVLPMHSGILAFLHWRLDSFRGCDGRFLFRHIHMCRLRWSWMTWVCCWNRRGHWWTVSCSGRVSPSSSQVCPWCCRSTRRSSCPLMLFASVLATSLSPRRQWFSRRALRRAPSSCCGVSPWFRLGGQ